MVPGVALSALAIWVVSGLQPAGNADRAGRPGGTA
jgi:hypothetical protein